VNLWLGRWQSRVAVPGSDSWSGLMSREVRPHRFFGNVGAGFTIKVGEPSYRVYIEPRYHYAPTQNVSTHLLEMTLGIRY